MMVNKVRLQHDYAVGAVPASASQPDPCRWLVAGRLRFHSWTNYALWYLSTLAFLRRPSIHGI